MSCSVNVKTAVTNDQFLQRACDRMRNAGLDVVGPRFDSNYWHARAIGGAHLVKLPGWHGNVAFYCNREGNVHYDSDHTGPSEILDRVVQEHGVAACEHEVEHLGGYAGESEIDATTGLLRFKLEIPEALSLA